MALTGYQREVCRLLADNRVRSGESYVAGGAALNEVLRASLEKSRYDLHILQNGRAWSRRKSAAAGTR